jgi:glycosyltransferase involved in cell wall biosynthesis
MVIISNGFNKFHLATAAASMASLGRLHCLITGAYPIPGMALAVELLSRMAPLKAQRLLDRAESIPHGRIRSLWFPELIDMMGMVFENAGHCRRGDLLKVLSMKLYGRMAGGVLKRGCREARIYHYRSGFGGQSIEIARDSGLVTLCDHSIVHPALISYLIVNGGKLPPKGERGHLNRFWQWILSDIERADHILVNSEFVRETFIHQGWDARRIHTIYWGVDDQFLGFLDWGKQKKRSGRKEYRLLFAGTFDTRKGADAVIDAVQGVKSSDWKFEIAGRVGAEVITKHPDFFKNTRIKLSGVLTRSELAGHMQSADVLILPSLAEGSARVIFEAMACGCFIITTPNAGSVVQDGVHGILVPPDDSTALKDAILWTMEQPEEVSRIGAQNAVNVRKNFQQNSYGDNLAGLYDRLVGS